LSPTGLKTLLPDRPFGAVCLGFATCDYLCLVPEFPPRGQKTYISRMVIDGGGQAATAACLLSRLGHKTAYVGVCGDDEAGSKIKPWFDEYGVDSSGLVLRPGQSSLQSFIMVEEGSAERTIVCHHGSSRKLRPQDLNPELIAQARVLHLDGHFIQASLEAARMAKRHGVLISMDGERIFPETKELVSMCDVVVGCHDFAQRLTGKTDPQDALRALADLGPAWTGRTMGAEGAEMLAAGRLYRQPAFQVQALDTTGAGDVFHGGLVHAILLGLEPQRALATASALAAVSVTGLGGRSTLPDREGLRAFMHGHGY
jgi:sulfofructose kinase